MQVIDFNIEKISDATDVVTQNLLSRLRRQFQSSNINFLLGAGFSVDVVGLLGDYEVKMAEAADAPKKLLLLQKEFFKSSILPLTTPANVQIGESNRIAFLSLIASIIRNRQSSILHKIINIFTTNYDLLLETALEKTHIDYVDGFSGKLHPTFSTANYGVIISRQTSISSMTSEIVTVNLYKVHGSLNWLAENNEVVCCDHIEKIKEIETALDTPDFIRKYSELAIINPTKEKLNTTVLNVYYYDQLRMFCNELEKNNTLLLAFGFSFLDEHIRQMTERSLKGNPTLSLLIFSFNDTSTEQYTQMFDSYQNVSVIRLVKLGEDENNGGDLISVDCTIDKVNDILQEVFNGIK